MIDLVPAHLWSGSIKVIINVFRIHLATSGQARVDDKIFDLTNLKRQIDQNKNSELHEIKFKYEKTSQFKHVFILRMYFIMIMIWIIA